MTDQPNLQQSAGWTTRQETNIAVLFRAAIAAGASTQEEAEALMLDRGWVVRHPADPSTFVATASGRALYAPPLKCDLCGIPYDERGSQCFCSGATGVPMDAPTRLDELGQQRTPEDDRG